MALGLRGLSLAAVLVAGAGIGSAGAQDGGDGDTGPDSSAPVSRTAVVETYADIALASYSDALQAAEDLQDAVDTMLRQPTEDNLTAAREAWQTARVTYQQTEVFRFGNPAVDDWVGRVNAWPVDEGYLDYVDEEYVANASDNPFYTFNLIAADEIEIGGETIILNRFTPDLIAETLHGAAGHPANVAAGYHAIEFLLWGQDAPGMQAVDEEGDDEPSGETEGAEDPTRPVTDFVAGEDCTNGHCERRAEYLFAAIDLLIEDLEEMVDNWEVTGAARRAVTDDPQAGIETIIKGIGSLTVGEIANDYLGAALERHDPRYEMDAFSDYSHISYLVSARGIVNVLLGDYFSLEGETTSGPSLFDLIESEDPELDAELRERVSVSMARLRTLVRRARDVETFDRMIAEGNEEGNATVQAAIDAFEAQGETLEKIDELLGVGPVAFIGGPDHNGA